MMRRWIKAIEPSKEGRLKMQGELQQQIDAEQRRANRDLTDAEQ